jgi:uncharacterized protein
LQNAGNPGSRELEIAVVGSGISGLSAAWLLSKRHRVTLYEADARLGGHSNTVVAGGVAVDAGFIVYNEATYPNFYALLDHLGVPTKPSNMTFSPFRLTAAAWNTPARACPAFSLSLEIS